jgi:hypothetical protein
MNRAFVEYLEKFMLESESIGPLQFELEQLDYKINEEKFEEEKRMNEQLKEVNKRWTLWKRSSMSLMKEQRNI